MAKAAVATGLIDYEVLWQHTGDCYAILDSIRMGYPMVPAGSDAEDVAKLAALVKGFKGAVAKTMEPEALVKHALAELEALSALKKREEIAPRALVLKAMMMAWEQLPDGETVVPITTLDLQSQNGPTRDGDQPDRGG
jgi:hypothetical protein